MSCGGSHHDFQATQTPPHILITYAGYPGEKRSRMINRVRQKFNDEEKVGNITMYIKDQRYLLGVLEIWYLSE
jgi:hypothetical protein